MKADAKQAEAARALQAFHERIHGLAPGEEPADATVDGDAGDGGGATWTSFMERWFGGGSDRDAAASRRDREGVGIYLYGRSPTAMRRGGCKVPVAARLTQVASRFSGHGRAQAGRARARRGSWCAQPPHGQHRAACAV